MFIRFIKPIKIIGIAFIFFSSSLLGFYYAIKIKFHISDLKKLNSALNILKSEIEFSLNPLSQALKNLVNLLSLSTSSSYFIQELFNKISINLDKKSNSAKDIWIHEIDHISNKLYLDPEDILNLKSFSQVICNLDSSLQINCLNKIISRLDKKILDLELNYNLNKKLYLNLGFLFGLLIIIIFI